MADPSDPRVWVVITANMLINLSSPHAGIDPMARRCQDDQDEITEADDTAGDATFCGSSLGEQWIEEVTDVEVVQTSQEEHLEGEHLSSRPISEGGRQRLGRKGVNNC